MSREQQGFSLIEALVAMLVLAIATVGLIRATEGHVDSTRATERRTAALWVAENRLAELALGRAATTTGEVAMLAGRWTVAEQREATDDPDIGRVRVEVTGAGESAPLVALDGFVDLSVDRTRS